MADSAPWTLLRLVQWTTTYFTAHRIDQARTEAEALLAHSLGLRRIDLYVNYDQPLDEDELQQFKTLIKRRVAGEPLAYITGLREFWSLALAVNPAVLIPRPETECLVEAVLPVLADEAAPAKRILDMGCGSGAITIALAHEHPHHHYVAMDRSPEALSIARQNARTHHVDASIDWFCGSWGQALAPQQALFDLIVSNPPYIGSDEMEGLQPEIRLFEPVSALESGADGLDSLRAIIGQVHGHLRSGGMLALEMGCEQAVATQAVAQGEGCYENINILQDYSGLDRIITMTRR